LLWAAGAFAFLLSCLSVSNPTLSATLYPIYLTLASALIAGVAWLRRARLGAAAPGAAG
jgi:hypothetical protein